MTILLFGITRDIVGSSTLAMPSSESKQFKTVRDLKSFLGSSYPELKKLSSLAVAVNNHYAADDVLINSADEIALIPPVSGG
ncbi:MoaD/ThiS family protein [uncultured Eudoraea sp.]|uniref:MoaD/ThiS family protein n=1 Tax=uncultured Eudoraea sp. TaxID=1035614 RepID=UPI00260C274C|nr:MoaD/ThiS family protein [uncultured Eudoraea sp.]